MNKLAIVMLLFFGSCVGLKAQEKLSYYLPDDVTYNPAIPTPESVIGHQVGQWHVTHDKLVYYMRALAKASDRVTIEEYAKSYEDRPLVLLTITTPENQGNIDRIQAVHQQLSYPSSSGDLNPENMPVVLYQGYSVHGDESSGANAALLYAYYLAAAQGKAIEKTLSNAVILLDPCFNPDGLNRFANYANMHKSKNPVTDPKTAEHNQDWPGGRTNHYWFDLNRDWLPVQHPESRGRIRNFHKWKPNILTDHHEMGTHSTFFFQPGIPSRTNPNTPSKNQELTGKIATYHAKTLDENGSFYYSKESFDDFYYGKGSTYPDVNGSVGILFEQASSRGHAQSSQNGTLTFPFTIKNQLLTSLSTLKAGSEMRVDLLNYQREFSTSALSEAAKDNVKGYVFTSQDQGRIFHFIELLRQHQIDIRFFPNSQTINGKRYEKGKAFIVPTSQPQYRLVKAIFEKRTTFTDSLFYDVSAWTLPLAFNLQYDELTGKVDLGKKVTNDGLMTGRLIGEESNYAYIFEWNNYHCPALLNHILSMGVKAKVASSPFSIETAEGLKNFKRGSILIPVNNNGKNSSRRIYNILKPAAARDGVNIYAVKSGNTPSGVDLGSNSMKQLRTPKCLLLVGSGISAYNAGEVWHLLDQRYDMRLTLAKLSTFNSMELKNYNTILMVGGGYSGINKSGEKNLKDWVSKGGILIPMGSAVNWASTHGLAKVSFKKKEKSDTGAKPYSTMSLTRGAQVIGGAIFENKIDLTHPLGYGFYNQKIPVFRRGTSFMKPAKNSYATPLSYTSSPLMSGYVSKANLETAKNSASIIVSGVGSGKVICMIDNPNFRAFWYGTNQLFTNAIFFGHTISSSAVERAD
jgi:hypothetical protein